MNKDAYLVIAWDIAGQEIIGPFDDKDAAISRMQDDADADEDFRHYCVIGPIPVIATANDPSGVDTLAASGNDEDRVPIAADLLAFADAHPRENFFTADALAALPQFTRKQVYNGLGSLLRSGDLERVAHGVYRRRSATPTEGADN